MAYFGSVDPAFYGIKADPLPFEPDQPISPELVKTHVLAISATLVQGTFGDRFASFQKEKPIAVLGGTIYLYDLRPGK